MQEQEEDAGFKGEGERVIGASPSHYSSWPPPFKAKIPTTSSSPEVALFNEMVRQKKRKGPSSASTETRNVASCTLDQKIELLRRRILRMMTVLVDPEVFLEAIMRRVSWEVDLKAVGTSIRHTQLTK